MLRPGVQYSVTNGSFRQPVMRWLLSAASVLILLLSTAACGGDAPATTAPSPSASAETPQDVLARVKADVAELRGLEFLEPVEAEYLSPQELGEYLQGRMGEEEREELRQLDELLTILGLIEPDADLVQLYLGLLSESVLGVYDTDDERLIVRLDGDAISPDRELTLAHELTHALQQQHFGIGALLEDAEDDFDRGLAVSALAEGDATLLEQFYLLANSLPLPDAPDTPLYDKAPKVIRDLLIFPYIAGLGMVTENLGEGGWDGIDAAYKDPPRSTEQVMHPAKYLEGEAPLEVTLPDLGIALNQDWTPVYSSVGGEFLIQRHLDSGLSTREASDAAAGWGGDAFALYHDGDDGRLLVWLLQWDSEKEAGEFYDGFTKLTGDESGWAENAKGGDSRTWGRTGRWVYVQKSADYVSLVIAPSEELTLELGELLQRP